MRILSTIEFKQNGRLIEDWRLKKKGSNSIRFEIVQLLQHSWNRIYSIRHWSRTTDLGDRQYHHRYYHETWEHWFHKSFHCHAMRATIPPILSPSLTRHNVWRVGDQSSKSCSAEEQQRRQFSSKREKIDGTRSERADRGDPNERDLIWITRIDATIEAFFIGRNFSCSGFSMVPWSKRNRGSPVISSPQNVVLRISSLDEIYRRKGKCWYWKNVEKSMHRSNLFWILELDKCDASHCFDRLAVLNLSNGMSYHWEAPIYSSIQFLCLI